jgi:hypothetical protein
MINYEKRLYKVVEDFKMELMHTDEANKLAKRLWVGHFTLQLEHPVLPGDAPRPHPHLETNVPQKKPADSAVWEGGPG